MMKTRLLLQSLRHDQRHGQYVLCVMMRCLFKLIYFMIVKFLVGLSSCASLLHSICMDILLATPEIVIIYVLFYLKVISRSITK